MPSRMSDSTAQDASPWLRVGATLLNLGILLIVLKAMELLVAATHPGPETALLLTTWLAQVGACTLYWLACARARTSPGLRLMHVKVVSISDQAGFLTLGQALLRPLPHFLFGIMLALPGPLIPAALVPLEYFVVLTSALLLASNTAPLWSGPYRRSLLDRWLRTRVIHEENAPSNPSPPQENEGSGI